MFFQPLYQIWTVAIATNGKFIQEAEITTNYNINAFPVSSENNLPTLQEWMHKAEEDLREIKAIPLL